MDNLARLIEPLPTSEFLSDYWTRCAIHVPGPIEKFSGLYSWQDLNELISDRRLTYPRLRLVLNKELLPASLFTKRSPHGPDNAIDPRKVSNLLRSGATIVYDGLHDSTPKIREFASLLQFDFGEYAHVNLYCSRPEAQGFDLHYDAHEVFLIQIAGKKEWRVSEPTRPFPLDFDKSGKNNPPGKQYLRCLLSAGDILYIPRGHWHEGIATGEASLHLTLGINGSTGMSFLRWLMDDLMMSEVWRANRPLAFSGDTKDFRGHSELESWIATLRTSLLERLGRLGLSHDYFEYSIGQDRNPYPYSLPNEYASLENMALAQETKFSRSRFQKVFIRDVQNKIRVTVGGSHLVFGGNVGAWVRCLFSETEFTGSDCLMWEPQLEWSQVESLLRPLITSGIVHVETQKVVENSES